VGATKCYLAGYGGRVQSGRQKSDQEKIRYGNSAGYDRVRLGK
jgi:hypothetical protein